MRVCVCVYRNRAQPTCFIHLPPMRTFSGRLLDAAARSLRTAATCRAQGRRCAAAFTDTDTGDRIYYAGTIMRRKGNTARGSHRVNFHGGRNDYYDIKPNLLHAILRYL